MKDADGNFKWNQLAWTIIAFIFLSIMAYNIGPMSSKIDELEHESIKAGKERVEFRTIQKLVLKELEEINEGIVKLNDKL